MENTRLLYLVQHTNKEMFKIGIATSNQRFYELDRDYSIDWKSSLYFKGDYHDITKMEKILHKLFYSYRLDKQNGTGGTEWFSTQCLDSVVESILFNTRNSNYVIDLKHNEIQINDELSIKPIIKKIICVSIPWNTTRQQIFDKYPKEIINKWKSLDKLNPTEKIINAMNRLIPEFHCVLKPSEYIAVELYKGFEHYSLSPIQHDALNFMCYKAREQINRSISAYNMMRELKTEDELFEFLETQHFDLNLNELALFADKYKLKQDKKELSNLLDSLQSVQVKVGIFKQDKNLGEIHAVKTMSLLRNYTKIKNSMNASFQMEPEILFGWVHKTKPFSKMYLKIQTTLKLTYSKILYEICKDYENQKTITKPFSEWLKVLGFSDELFAAKTVSQFKQAYLNKSIVEINEHTDIFIKSITGKKVDGQVTMTVDFEKQLCALIENGSNDNAKNHQHYLKSKTKLDELIKNGYKVFDVEMWIQADIKKNSERYDAENRIDSWLRETDVDAKNKLFEVLALNLECCDDPMVSIENYQVKGVFSKDTFTKNPQETIALMNTIIRMLD